MSQKACTKVNHARSNLRIRLLHNRDAHNKTAFDDRLTFVSSSALNSFSNDIRYD